VHAHTQVCESYNNPRRKEQRLKSSNRIVGFEKMTEPQIGVHYDSDQHQKEKVRRANDDELKSRNVIERI
jgi:hypothetical protein